MTLLRCDPFELGPNLLLKAFERNLANCSVHVSQLRDPNFSRLLQILGERAHLVSPQNLVVVQNLAFAIDQIAQASALNDLLWRVLSGDLGRRML